MMKTTAALHPFLFAIFPVLFLFAQNAGDMRLSAIFVPLAFQLALAAILLLVAKALFKDIEKSAIIASASIVALFSYGHLLNLGYSLGLDFDPYHALPNYLLMGAFTLIFLVIVWIVLRLRSGTNRLTVLLNLMAAGLVLIQLISSGYVLVGRAGDSDVGLAVTGMTGTPSYRPDIYYIVVDGYGRQDMLKTIFDFDNSEFIDFLRQRGFYVADSSYSNYGRTQQSLASSLNLEYLDILYEAGDNIQNRIKYGDFIQRNVVLKGLKLRGYNVVSFISGYDITAIRDAEVILSHGYGLTEFQGLIINTTPLPFIFDNMISPYNLHRRRILYALDKIGNINEVDQPRFVFAHILSPHPPFLFDENGGPSNEEKPFGFSDGSHYFNDGGTRESYLKGYRNQIIQVTEQLRLAVDRIFEQYGDNPPIIIIQGDHGSGLHLNWESSYKTWHRERFAILNAYYFPRIGYDDLYPGISPVNTFRLILREYFGIKIDPVPDSSYFSRWDGPFSWENVTDRLDESEPPRGYQAEDSGR